MPRRRMMRCSATGMTMALNDQGDDRGDVEMRRVLDEGLPGDRQRQHQRVQREDVEQRRTAGPGRACMKLISTSPPASICAMSKARPWHRIRGSSTTNSSRVPSRPSMSATPRNWGTRKTRILAIAGLEQREQEAGDGELADDRRRRRWRSGAGPAAVAARCCQGSEQAGDQRDIRAAA